MKQIDKYVNSVYKHVGGDKEEIEILKCEMKNHLLQFIEELQSEGISEEESISIAINRFGEENQIENELIGVFKFVNKRAKKALIIVAAFLLITIISFSFSVIANDLYWKQIETRNNEIFNILSSYNEVNIESIDKDISAIFNKSKTKFRYVAISSSHNSYGQLVDIEYIYPSDFKVGTFDTGGTTGTQITTEVGSKAAMIGRSNEDVPPKYIRKIGRSSFVWLGFCLISIIAWALIRADIRINYRH